MLFFAGERRRRRFYSILNTYIIHNSLLGFMFAMPWKLKGMQLNEIDWQMPQWMLAAGAQLRINSFEQSTESTKPPAYLQVLVK